MFSLDVSVFVVNKHMNLANVYISSTLSMPLLDCTATTCKWAEASRPGPLYCAKSPPNSSATLSCNLTSATLFQPRRSHAVCVGCAALIQKSFTELM